ncbi:PRKC apoptosis WT1 regulator protein [Egretta garzetta]|uniref:PRKC apoptosis WT1 regulator protein n=1 Tax=Egretta garzetta TaxID=188379 RepID=UPI00163CAD6D|nr:PRKC apoptosis WT1 regulator protein [Egretta garzetta]
MGPGVPGALGSRGLRPDRCGSCKNQKTPEATSPQDLEHSLNFPVSGERHSELLRADTECENSLHISLTSPYKLTDAPPLLERTGPPPPSAHRRRQSSQSLLCAAQVTRALLGRPSLDEYEDDEAGQKERKKEDAITQQNTIQNENSSADTPGSYLLQDSSRMVSSRYKSTANAPEDDAPNRYSRPDRTTYSRYSRDANSSGSSVPSSALEKRIEELERELAKERQENARLMKMTQDKEELIGKLKEEIDLLNRDLDDIEDENEQLKQENKTLLKVVGQLTR